jgi:hypothetical protein
MKPIKAEKVVERGIAIYVPRIGGYTKAKIEIYYSPKNPLFEWSFCEDSPYKIWEKIENQFSKGVLFIYNSPTLLPKGFYRIQLKTINKEGGVLQGSKTYGLIRPKSSLHVGLPYSSLSPITLS